MLDMKKGAAVAGPLVLQVRGKLPLCGWGEAHRDDGVSSSDWWAKRTPARKSLWAQQFWRPIIPVAPSFRCRLKPSAVR